MDYVLMALLVLLGLSIFGTFILVVSVSVYIYKQMVKDKVEIKHTCSWKSNDTGVYNTDCGEEFFDATESGNPVTDWVNFCPYCSRKVKE